MCKLKKKLSQQRGETLVETLAALLIMSLAMMILAGAILSSARLNRQAGEANTLTLANAAHTGGTDGSVTVSAVDISGTDKSRSYSVRIYSYHATEGGSALYDYSPK